MKLVITGGAGFLAYHLTRRLASKCDRIVLIDIAPIESGAYPENAACCQADVRDRAALQKHTKGADFLIHAAAALPLCSRKEIFEVNLGGTDAALEAAQTNHVRKVVYISSTAVYGIPKVHPIDESAPLAGIGPYGESKIEAESICRAYQKKGLPVAIVRPKTFLGTGRLGVFQILYDWVDSGNRIPMIGNGRNHYQLLAVEDLVDAIDLLLNAPAGAANDTFNIGAERFGTVEEDLSALCRFAGTGSRPVPTPAWIAKPVLRLLEQMKLSPLYQWVYDTADTESFVSTEKIKKAVGWTPKLSNAETLIQSFQWYREHKHELAGTGTTHRTAWKQGALSLLKKLL